MFLSCPDPGSEVSRRRHFPTAISLTNEASSLGSCALTADSSASDLYLRLMIGIADDDGLQALTNWLITILSPSLRRLLSHTLDRVHIVEPLRRHILPSSRD
jgi:hypothetical protein